VVLHYVEDGSPPEVLSLVGGPLQQSSADTLPSGRWRHEQAGDHRDPVPVQPGCRCGHVDDLRGTTTVKGDMTDDLVIVDGHPRPQSAGNDYEGPEVLGEVLRVTVAPVCLESYGLESIAVARGPVTNYHVAAVVNCAP